MQNYQDLPLVTANGILVVSDPTQFPSNPV